MNATIFDVQKCSFVDGPGIRTTVFFKGCNLDCKWCHNPEGKSKEPQLLFYKDKCSGCGVCKSVCKSQTENCSLTGECAKYCPNHARVFYGREYTVDELFSEIEKDKLFYATSGGGVTFSGGECMLQIDFLEKILKKCKESGIHTAVDTAGNVSWEHFERILPYTDLFLYDVKCVSEDLHKEGTGVSNCLILDNLNKLISSFAKIIVRVPIIPEFNGKDDEIKKIKEYVNGLEVQKVEWLPYHSMGVSKSEAMGVKQTIYSTPTKELLEKYQN